MKTDSRGLREEGLGDVKDVGVVPVGSACEDGTAKADGGPGATAVSGGAEWSIDAAQQAHVHRTQDAGQPLSGADSLVPIGHVSGTRSDAMPLASAMSTAMNTARRMPVNISVGAQNETYRGRSAGLSPDRSIGHNVKPRIRALLKRSAIAWRPASLASESHAFKIGSFGHHGSRSGSH